MDVIWAEVLRSTVIAIICFVHALFFRWLDSRLPEVTMKQLQRNYNYANLLRIQIGAMPTIMAIIGVVSLSMPWIFAAFR